MLFTRWCSCLWLHWKNVYSLDEISGFVAWYSTKFVACPHLLEIFCSLLRDTLEIRPILPHTWHCSILKRHFEALCIPPQWWHSGACDLRFTLRVCVAFLFALPCLAQLACILGHVNWTVRTGHLYLLVAISYALANINAFPANNLCWVCVLCNPDTNLSLNMWPDLPKPDKWRIFGNPDFCISEFYIPKALFCSNTNAVLQILFELQG